MNANFDSQLAQSAQTEWSKIAKESVNVEVVCGVMYAFGSELACLRIYKAFLGKGRVEYSKNLKSWFFSDEA